MNRTDSILAVNKQLYERLKNTPDLDGCFSFDGFSIEWRRKCRPYLRISWDTVCFMTGKCSSPFHWHPESDYADLDDFWSDIVSIGKKDHILVIRDCFLFQHILYMGSAEGYFSNRKLYKKLGKKYIFGDVDGK